MIKGEDIPETGNSLQRSRPQLYAAVLQDLMDGMSARKVAKKHGIDVHVACAVRRNAPEMMQIAKEHQARSFQELARVSSETAMQKLAEDPDKISFKDLMIGAAIATDKALGLRGEATERVEVVVKHEDDELDEIIRKAKTAKVIDVDAQFIDVKEPSPLRSTLPPLGSTTTAQAWDSNDITPHDADPTDPTPAAFNAIPTDLVEIKPEDDQT